MNEYYNKCLDFQEKLKEYASNIFRTYGRELVLRLNEHCLDYHDLAGKDLAKAVTKENNPYRD